MTVEELKKVENLAKRMVSEGSDPQHGWDHLERVRLNSLKIAKILKAGKPDLNLLQAMCLLHDVPVNLFKSNLISKHYLEKYAVRIYLPPILKELKLQEKDADEIYKAVLNHPYSYPYRKLNKKGSICAKIMQDADTLDFFSRVREKSFNDGKKLYFSYRLAGVFSDFFLKWGRQHLAFFLNYPELAKYNWS